ncbi:hypothetical protein [Marivita geojedonensis]|uniref:Uncharacterized protein n=1 Tax=Marivita geojedonensis TaxID=1123756 RepID=A0A1X4NCA2_9RHOB|nr:hypothetical protein [Marivita geojedonensis]OSQ44329.1 hypothetical protein MGEO_19140 [Marivita geojedonensis]PRY72899.1 hypothetical protein CLV76_13211 [Marivita geojedonensis]
MTTERQRHANAANASKSTGPKTAQGRAASARNAWKHGLTTLPPWDDITRFYRGILSDPEGVPDLTTRDPRMRAALTLAEAEAQLARCLAAERQHLILMAERARPPKHVSVRDIINKAHLGAEDLDVARFMLARVDEDWMRETLKILIRSHPDRPAELQRRLKVLRRYRREAEARRRKALRHWLTVGAALQTESEKASSGEKEKDRIPETNPTTT